MGEGASRDAGADNENVVVWTGHARTGQKEKWKTTGQSMSNKYITARDRHFPSRPTSLPRLGKSLDLSIEAFGPHRVAASPGPMANIECIAWEGGVSP